MKKNNNDRNFSNLYDRIVRSNENFELSNLASISHQTKDEIFNKARQGVASPVANSKEELESPEEKFVRSLFSLLHAGRWTSATSDDAVTMYKIYNRALYYYPQFEACSYETQISIMHEAFMKGRLFENHDIHVYAQATFQVFESNGLIDTIIAPDRIENIYKEYHKVFEHRVTRRNYEHPSEVWEYNALIYVMYEYMGRSGVKFKTCFHPSDLWNLLSGQRTI